MYVRSQYDEESSRREGHPSLPGSSIEKTRVSGVAHGIAFASGMDFRLAAGLGFRIGIQLGYFERNDNVSLGYAPFQLGFAFSFIAPVRLQSNIGVCYNLGRIKNKIPRQKN